MERKDGIVLTPVTSDPTDAALSPLPAGSAILYQKGGKLKKKQLGQIPFEIDQEIFVANPRDYGAVGDGVTDDTAAIQAALDSGKEVVISDGTYKHGMLSFGQDRYYTIRQSANAILKPQGDTDVLCFEDGITQRNAVRWYRPRFECDPDKTQTFAAFEDQSSLWKLKLYDPYIENAAIYFDVRAADVTYEEPVDIRVYGGYLNPRTHAKGDSILAKTPMGAGTFAFGCSIFFHGTEGYNPGAGGSFTFDFDGDLILTDGAFFYVIGACKANAFDMRGTKVIGGTGDGSDSIKVYGGSFYGGFGVSQSQIDYCQMEWAAGFEGAAGANECLLTHGSKLIASAGAVSFRGVKQPGLDAVTPDIAIDIKAGADGSSVVDCDLRLASVALVQSASQKVRVMGSKFTAPGAVNTVKDSGAGDYTIGVGNTGLSTGGGLALAINSKITIGDYNFA